MTPRTVLVWGLVLLSLTPVWAQEITDVQESTTLDIRDAVMYLSRQHNRQKQTAFRLSEDIRSQIPLVALADAVDQTTRNRIQDVEYISLGSMFSDLSVALALFYHFEVYVSGCIGLWTTEAYTQLARTHTLDFTFYEFLGGLSYRALKGDIVPFVTVFGGASFISTKLKQNFVPKREVEVDETLWFVGGGVGVDIYFTRHFGTRFQFVYFYYMIPDALQSAEFNDVTLDFFPFFPNNWSNLAFVTGLFFEI